MTFSTLKLRRSVDSTNDITIQSLMFQAHAISFFSLGFIHSLPPSLNQIKISSPSYEEVNPPPLPRQRFEFFQPRHALSRQDRDPTDNNAE